MLGPLKLDNCSRQALKGPCYVERIHDELGSCKVQGASSHSCVGDAVEVGVHMWSPRISWIGRRESARGCLWGEVEISGQVVGQFYMGVRGGCW